MKTKTENKSFIRAWKLNMRALKLLHGEMPGWFTATILNGLLAAAAPYAAIWFSARLIAELCGGRDVNVLTRYVILILASTALLMLLKAFLLFQMRRLTAGLKMFLCLCLKLTLHILM